MTEERKKEKLTTYRPVGYAAGKNGLTFHFESGTCLNYPFCELFLSVGNLKVKTEEIFQAKIQAEFLSIESPP